MTSATVTQLGEMIANISGNAGNTETQTGEFAGIFQTAAGKSEGAGPQETVKTSVTEKNMSVSKTADKLREQRTEEVSNEPKDMEVVEKELEAAAEELKEEIAEKLDITVEELEAVMETLGLTDASLFTQEGMTALVMEVEQISTSIELLTNADAYQTLQDLNAVAGELLEQVQNENQLTDVEMKEVLEQFSKVKVVSQGVSADETDMQNITGETDEAENADTIEGKQPADSEADAETSTKDVNSVKDATTPNGKESEAGNKGNEQNTNHNQQVAAESNFQLNNTQTVNQTTTDFSQNITGGNLSTQEIYDQIGEFIKTNIRPGIAEVEMQLNPENLGTVSIHLSSKQGNVTAQFVVQNEAVKAALEMQMIQLKENFAEQGIKVDAVEVTVESHAFNQNMQQSNEENNQAQAEARKSSTRSINLNGDWTEEELTEEEQLVAEMMEADGNTVDFKA
ncbi:MAG: flagellar hook-length control protein FliK [Lachnospiraceae bacterium]|nr:flagellar hook-length control protein FliK [Lachnospiraceae bacterium]